MQGLFCAENKDTKEIRPLGGNWREGKGYHGALEIRKFPALITKAQWRGELLIKTKTKTKTEHKQVKKKENPIFLARRNSLIFKSPETCFHCKTFSKKIGSSDSTAEGQPVVSHPPTTDTHWRDIRIH